MPIGTNIGIDVEVIEEDKVFRQLPVIWRGGLIEESQRRVTVADAEIAQHLVVSAILFDNVDDVLNRRRTTGLGRNGIAGRNVHFIE